MKFEVDTALNGEEGLFLALQNIYDAILLDVMMPEMDGFEVIQKYVMKRLKHQSYFNSERFFRRSGEGIGFWWR